MTDEEYLKERKYIEDNASVQFESLPGCVEYKDLGYEEGDDFDINNFINILVEKTKIEFDEIIDPKRYVVKSVKCKKFRDDSGDYSSYYSDGILIERDRIESKTEVENRLRKVQEEKDKIKAKTQKRNELNKKLREKYPDLSEEDFKRISCAFTSGNWVE